MDDEKEQTTMPHHYRASLSSGIYGSFTAYQRLQKMKMLQKMKQKQAEEKKQNEFLEEMKVKEKEIKSHRTAVADFSVIQIPSSVTNKSRELQLLPMAGMYKKILFDHMPRKQHLGGWVFLAAKNAKNNANKKMCSPKELGYSIIEPKYIGDPVYQKSVIRFLRDDIITISGCVGKSGSYYVSVTFDNNKNKDVKFTIPKGMVWEQDRFRKVQNLAVTGFYKTQPENSQAQLNLAEDLEITIPANAKGVVVNIQCYCIDHNHSSPNGEGMNATPLRCEAAVNATSQGEAWKNLTATEPGDIF